MAQKQIKFKPIQIELIDKMTSKNQRRWNRCKISYFKKEKICSQMKLN